MIICGHTFLPHPALAPSPACTACPACTAPQVKEAEEDLEEAQEKLNLQALPIRAYLDQVTSAASHSIA